MAMGKVIPATLTIPPKTMTITKLTQNRFCALDVVPDQIETVQIPALKNCCPFLDGTAAHAALNRFFRDRPLSERHRSFLPLLLTIQAVCNRSPGRTIYSEKTFAWNAIGHGRVDAIALSTTSSALLELKIVSQIPAAPRGADLVQLASYAAMCRHTHPHASWEAILVYADLGRGIVCFFSFRKTSGMCDQVREALAA
ncbi:MAG TPA: hypothetical protein VHE81_19850 [Lacipirellulaceae bacterium]|nr:hypothetical protein [Lacipirellulaceae bacterium]